MPENPPTSSTEVTPPAASPKARSSSANSGVSAEQSVRKMEPRRDIATAESEFVRSLTSEEMIVDASQIMDQAHGAAVSIIGVLRYEVFDELTQDNGKIGSLC